MSDKELRASTAATIRAGLPISSKPATKGNYAKAVASNAGLLAGAKKDGRIFAEYTALTPTAVLAAVDSVQRTAARYHSPSELACGSGCSHCCSQAVAAYPLEVLAISMAGPFERVEQHVQITRPLSEMEQNRRRLPCPLLQPGGLCQVYSRRPLLCRAENSVDARQCSLGIGAAHEFDPVQVTYHTALLVGMAEGFAGRGLDSQIVELAKGLQELSESYPTPRAALEDWLSGKAIFSWSRLKGRVNSVLDGKVHLAVCRGH